MKPVHIVKGIPKALKILMGQSRNQIQMQVDVISLLKFAYHLADVRKRTLSVNRLQGIFVGGLYADFKLEQPRPHLL